MNLFLIFNTFANLIFNFVSSTASVSITGSPSKLQHLIVDVDMAGVEAEAGAEAEAEPVPLPLPGSVDAAAAAMPGRRAATASNTRFHL